MKRKRLIQLSVGTLILVATCGSLFVLYKVFWGPQKDVLLAKNYTIGTETTAIAGDGVLIVDRDKQFISLVLKDGFVPVLKEGIRSPTGEIIHVEITLVDEDGRTYPLRFTSWNEPGTILAKMIDAPTAEFNSPGYTWPKGQRFSRIELKSDVPFEVRKLYWSGYNWNEQP